VSAVAAEGRPRAPRPPGGPAALCAWAPPRRKLLIESPHLRHADFSPDARWLATGNGQGEGVKVWDVQSGKLAHDLDFGKPEEQAAWPAFSPDGQWLVTGSYAEYRFWEVGSWQKKHGLPREKAVRIIGWIVFSPDGQMLAVLPSMSEGHLVDPATGRPFPRFARRGSSLLLQPRRQPAGDRRRPRRGLPGLGAPADPPAARGDGPRLGPAALPAARRGRQAAARPGAGRRAASALGGAGCPGPPRTGPAVRAGSAVRTRVGRLRAGQPTP